MSKVFRPRRGKSTSMATETKAATVLAQGEMFVETPSTGVGTGESNIKLGDGTTTYGSLPYALGSAAPTSLVSDASTTATTALNNVTSGKSLKNILGSLKQAISLNSTSITALNDTISSMTSTSVKLSSSNTTTDSIAFGKDSSNNYGYIIPGADTVTPFKKLNRVSIGSGGNGTYSATSIPGYKSLTADNFAFVVTSYNGGGSMTGSWDSDDVGYGTGISTSGRPNISYNSSTGIVTMSGLSATSSASQGSSQGYRANKTASASISGTVYCFY